MPDYVQPGEYATADVINRPLKTYIAEGGGGLGVSTGRATQLVSGAAIAVPLTNLWGHPVLVTASTTISFTGGVAGGHYIVEVIQDANGGWTVSFDPSIKFSGGNVPTLTTAADSKDIFYVYFDGSFYQVIGYQLNLPVDVPAVSIGASPYYVSPTGTRLGDGSIGSPWSLSYALGGKLPIPAGSTVFLRGGTYNAIDFHVTLAGAAGNYIRITNYPGERVIIDGRMQLYGSYTELRGNSTGWFEFSQVDPVTTGLRAVEVRGIGNRCINLVVHDVGGSGILVALDGTGNEVCGCIIYNCGTHEGLDHGIYSYTKTTETLRLLRENIIFHNQGYGLHCYGKSISSQFQKNDQLIGNYCFNNGAIAKTYARKPQAMIGGDGIDVTLAVIQNNVLINMGDLTEVCLHVGYDTSKVSTSADVRFNTIYGGSFAVQFEHFTTMNFSNNDVMGPNRILSETDLAYGGYTFNNNTYRRAVSPSAAFRIGAAYNAFAAWQAATGLDSLSTEANSANAIPTANKVVLRVNPYDGTKAHLMILNWLNLANVAVDISPLVPVGKNYTIRSVQDLFGTPVLTGVYGGGTVNIPMNAILPPTPQGSGRNYNVPPTTGPQFDAFLVTYTP